MSRTGLVEVLRREQCGQILEEVHDRYRRATPGALGRPHHGGRRARERRPVTPSPRYVAVHRDGDGGPDGYASYWIDSGTVTVDETPNALPTACTGSDPVVATHRATGTIRSCRCIGRNNERPSHAATWCWLR